MLLNQELLDSIDSDYFLSKDDIVDAKRIEPYYKIFGIFNLKDPKMTTLVLATARTISRQGGILTRFELDELLNYLHLLTILQIWLSSISLPKQIPQLREETVVYKPI